MPIRPYLHADIYDSNNPQLDERTFQRRNAKNGVVYDCRFREAFPTMWACAYELDKLVQAYGAAEDPANLSADHHAAVEEWVSMLALYYSGVINPEIIDKRAFIDEGTYTSEYDPDLWPALSGTFPGRAADPLSSLTLLRADDEERTVVGAYYPHLVFFPNRGRGAWRRSPVITRYLADSGESLSWARTFAETVREPADRAELASYLASVGETLGGAYGTAINKFCRSRGLNLPASAQRFRDKNPFARHSGWKRAIVEDADAIMKSYPLVREVVNNGVTQRTYFLVQDLRSPSPWMSEKIGKGMPTPHLIRKRTETQVIISWAGREIPYKLKRTAEGAELNEYVELLKDMFIDKPAYWCKQPGAPAPGQGPFSAAIELCHKQEVNSHENRSRELRQLCEDTALILAPINEKFVQHFGHLDDQQQYGSDPAQQARRLKGVSCTTVDEPVDGGVKESASWTFTVAARDGRELPITWTGVIEQSPKLVNKSVALWPPKVSADWRLYAIRSVGEKKKESGSWGLVDENGTYGTPESKSDSENLSVLQDSTKPNRPVALMLRDALDQPRGIFFLKLQPSVNAPDKARLGVDFGTSNTCLSYVQEKDNKPNTLVFSLKPAWVWGRPQEDIAGFVPYEWHGRPFYSTVLLAPKSNLALSNRSSAEITASDLFQVDIPVLRKGGAESLYFGGLEKNWNAYPDLKWDVEDENRAWRAFFLSLSLVYAHAELLFNKGMKVSECVWTYPLAFSGGKDRMFQEEADAILKRVQELCHGEAHASTSRMVNESEAIALSQGVGGEGRNYVDVFIDIGGGSTDIAVYGNDRFLVQDSIEVAGRAFFSFAEESVDPEHPYSKYDTKGAQNFRENLNRLLRGTNGQLTLPSSQYSDGQAFTAYMYKLDTFYSISVGNLSETAPDNKHSLTQGERKIIEGGSINNRSYQTYRSRLFYRHIISYALLQACAAVLNDPGLDPKFRLICSGNGWGLTLFAGMNKGGNTVEKAIKQEANYLLDGIKKSLHEKAEAGGGKTAGAGGKKAEAAEEADADAEKTRKRIEELAINTVKFLGRGEAKVAVAHGAVKKLRKAAGTNGEGNDGEGQEGEQEQDVGMVSYTGLRLDPVKVNGQHVNVDWLDQWSKERLLRNVPEKHNGIKSIEFERPAEDDKPFDPLLSVFVSPRDKWGEVNSVVRMNGQYEENKELTKSPINQLLARVLYPRGDRHYFLENMARAEKCE